MNRMKLMSVCLAGCAAFAVAAAPASAETFAIKLTGQHGGLFKGRSKIAIPSYSINYITAQQATGVGGIGARARLNSVLEGVDEATMRRLANEGHADLKAQLAAAGINVSSDEEARGVLAAGAVTLLPNNVDEGGGGGGISIGSNVKKAFVSYGADAAPLSDLYKAGVKVGGIGMIANIGKGGKLNRPAEAIDATLLFPALTVDFAEMSASGGKSLGGERANVSGDVVFSIRMESPVNIQNPAAMGMGTPGMMRPEKDVKSATPFAATNTGAADVRALSTGGKTRGDAIVVDLPIWTGLVQDAYRSYNAAIVAAVVKFRK